MKRLFFLVFSLLLLHNSKAQIKSASGEILPPYLNVHANWVDSLLDSMTLDEKIGQLFMIACWSRNPDSEMVRVGKLINENHIGGIIFMQGGPLRQAALTNYFQAMSKVPLLISQDAEWGLSMRIDSVINFSKELMLGALRDTILVHDFGKEMARELKRIGVNISFSPVIDINNNPLNPVIGDRSFGENKYDVTNYGLAYMHGLQNNGIIACAKHFPGHGNTDQDSHKVLPVIHATREELDSTELYPFRKLIDAGVGCVMVAHLNIPALDTTQKLPSTLSPAIVTGLLRNDLGFHGLVITDALNMKGVADFLEPGPVDVNALLAGNDILLFSQDVPLAVQMIKDAITAGKISETDINIRVRKILQAKYWCGLNHFQPIELKHLYDDLNSLQAQFLKQQIIEKSLVLARNKNQFIPIQRLDTFHFAAVAIGDTMQNDFQEILSNYSRVKHFSIPKNASEKKFDDLIDSLKHYNGVFISLHGMSRLASINYGVTDRSRTFLEELRKQKKVFLTLFGSPYALQYFDNFDYVLDAFNDDPMTQQFAAQVWFGGIGAQGKLPVTASAEYFRGRGYITSPIREKYSMPEDVGINSDSIGKIDDIVYEALAERAMPGCEIFIAKDGKVIWNKSYGNFTYDSIHEVKNNNLYDLASVTKVAATTLMVMKLYEQKKIDLNKCVEDYLPEFKN
ncbi:MAG: glycoside hydrolase family 3 N-terminal domain-containing protein, partial [Chitinophagales bacterium]